MEKHHVNIVNIVQYVILILEFAKKSTIILAMRVRILFWIIWSKKECDMKERRATKDETYK